MLQKPDPPKTSGEIYRFAFTLWAININKRLFFVFCFGFGVFFVVVVVIILVSSFRDFLPTLFFQAISCLFILMPMCVATAVFCLSLGLSLLASHLGMVPPPLLCRAIVLSLAPASKRSLWLHFENLQDYSHAPVHNGTSLLTLSFSYTSSASRKKWYKNVFPHWYKLCYCISETCVWLLIINHQIQGLNLIKAFFPT